MWDPRMPRLGCGPGGRLPFPIRRGTIRPELSGHSSAGPQRGPTDRRGARPATPLWPALQGACIRPPSTPALSCGPWPAGPLILDRQVAGDHIGHWAEELLGVHLVRLRLPLQHEAVVQGKQETCGAMHVHVSANDTRALGAGEEPCEGGGTV